MDVFCYLQGSGRILICKFEEFSRTIEALKQKCFSKVNIHRAYMNKQKAQNNENETFLGILRMLLYDFL